MGTLACGRNVDSLLFRELLVLRACFNNILAPASPVQAIQNQFARITLLLKAGKMAQDGENVGIMDIKKNLRCLYELLSISVMDNREMARVVKKMEDTVSYTSLQISNHDSRIDDNESSLREIMGKVDRIQEDLQKFISMNQSSRFHAATDDVALPMEEESVVQPRNPRGNPYPASV